MGELTQAQRKDLQSLDTFYDILFRPLGCCAADAHKWGAEVVDGGYTERTCTKCGLKETIKTALEAQDNG